MRTRWPLVVWIELQSSVTDALELGEISESLRKRCEALSERQAFVHWIVDYSSAWVRERRPGLAAVLEAAAILNMPEAVGLFTDVLECGTAIDPLTFQVAGQRIRLLKITDDTMRRRCVDALRAALEAWGEAPDRARAVGLVAASASSLAFPEDADWIAQSIRSGCPALAYGLSQGILDAPRDQSTMLLLATAILARLVAGRPDTVKDDARIRSSLIWSLGAVTSVERIPMTVEWMRDAFKNGRSLDAAGVIHALNGMVRREPDVTYRALLSAFENDPDERVRVLTLMFKMRPRMEQVVS